MRLTREMLLKIARDTAAQRSRVSRRIICIYLTGSVLNDEPLLGGTTDIDLFIVHDSEPLQPREIVRLSNDVHLDIAHYAEAVFHQPRQLRTDPWLGPFIYSKPLVLYDTHHWFDFLQASTGAQFYQPDYTLQRAKVLAQSARQNWMDLNLSGPDSQSQRIKTYLKILEDAGNAIACLSGPPLPVRRYFLQFPSRAQEINRPELAGQMVDLFTTPESQEAAVLQSWASPWKEALSAAAKQADSSPRLQPARMPYYQQAAAAMTQDHPIAAMWVILKTWADAAAALGEDAPHNEGWLEACRSLHLDDEHFSDRLDQVDHYLDNIEETLDTWGRENGVLDSV